MFASNILSRLPPGATLLVLAAILSPSAAHALPQQTKTVEYREFHVRPYPIEEPPAPTDAIELDELFRRQVNTICGYVGGDPDLPATCSAGSHCVVEADQGYIGCCPDSGPCTEGIYTGCVDRNSDPQTEINPYIYTCDGGDVCYQNEFEGGFFQYGCGSASTLAATVAGSASDRQSLSVPTLSVEFTAEATSLSEPTTLGTRTSRSSESSSTRTDSSTSSESSSSSTTETRTSDERPTTTGGSDDDDNDDDSDEDSNDDAPGEEDNNDAPVGAIVGGSIGAVAFIAVIATMALYLIRRRQGNVRQGPGQHESEHYMSPMSNYRNNFAPLPTIQDVEESSLPQTMPPAFGYQRSRDMDTISEENLLLQDNRSGTPRAVSPLRDPSSDGTRYPSSDLGVGPVMGGSSARIEPDRVPLTTEVDDFARGFNAAVDDLHGHHTPPQPPPSHPTTGSGESHDYMSEYPGPRNRSGGGALWQQNRATRKSAPGDWI